MGKIYLVVALLVGASFAQAEVILGTEVPDYAKSVDRLEKEMSELGYAVTLAYPVSQRKAVIPRSEFCVGAYAVERESTLNVITFQFNADLAGLKLMINNFDQERVECQADVVDARIVYGTIHCQSKTSLSKTIELKPVARKKPNCVS